MAGNAGKGVNDAEWMDERKNGVEERIKTLEESAKKVGEVKREMQRENERLKGKC